MTDRLDLLKMIYVPRSLGADELLRANSEPEFDALNPEFTLGVRYVADKFFPILAEDTAAKLTPVSADIMRQVVADKLNCEWRLKRDGFKIQDVLDARYFEKGSIWMVYGIDRVYVKTTLMIGVHTYTDLITLVQLAEG